jgi:hypothetical protein
LKSIQQVKTRAAPASPERLGAAPWPDEIVRPISAELSWGIEYAAVTQASMRPMCLRSETGQLDGLLGPSRNTAASGFRG